MFDLTFKSKQFFYYSSVDNLFFKILVLDLPSGDILPHFDSQNTQIMPF